MRQNRNAALAILLLFGPIGSAKAQTPVSPVDIPLSEYRALLRDFESAAKRPLPPVDASAWAQRFQKSGQVVLPDGSKVKLDNADIVQALNKVTGKATTLDAELLKRTTATLRLIEAPANAQQRPDPRQQIARILSAKEFQAAQKPKAQNTWWDDLREKIGKAVNDFLRWLGRLLGPRGRASGGGGWFASAIQWTLIVFGIVVVAVGLFYLLRWASHRGFAPRKRSGVLSGLDLLEETSADPLGDAQSLSAQGDHRSAVRMAYIATLRRLATSGLLLLQENHTNWEYQRDLRSRSVKAYEALLPATRLFDVIWYGQRSASREEFVSVIAAYNAIVDLEKSGETRPVSSDGKGRSA